VAVADRQGLAARPSSLRPSSMSRITRLSTCSASL
jgi:hypothetical protein